MVQIWEENLDFSKKSKTALLSLSIYSKKCRNFRSIGFKGPVLIFVDLIFFWQKGSYCGLYRFWGKNKKTFIFNRLDGIVILIKKSYLLISGADGEKIS